MAMAIGPLPSGQRWITTEQLQDRLTRTIHEQMSEKNNVIIPSPTSSGKSHNGATTRWRTTEAAGDSPVIHLHWRKDSRKKACEKSEKHNVEYRELLGRKEACTTCAGEHNDVVKTPTGEPASDWLDKQVGKRENTLSNAHNYLANYNGGELPCSPCPSIDQWKGVPYDEDGNITADVIHATHNFSYVPGLVCGANIFFDEQPDFKRSIGERDADNMTRSRFQDIITAWLKKIESPVTSWEMFVTLATDGFDELEHVLKNPPSVDVDWFIEGENAHALAPALSEAAYYAYACEKNRTERRVGWATNDITRFDTSKHDDPRYSRTRITLIVDDDNRPAAYWNVPELGNARSIICLDAWPSIHEWKMNIGDGISVERIVTDEEFRQWRKFERGLEVVQIGHGTRPASTDFAVDEYTDPKRQQTVVESLHNKYGSAFRSAIYPRAMDDQFSEFLSEDFETILYGREKSNNAFSDESIGLVTNSIDPGDDYVLDLLAARGFDAEPETWDCIDCPGEECPICGGEPNRKPGRNFVGPDADKAKDILNGVRKNTTAQAIGRWARKSDSPRALVFVRTSAAPDLMVDTTIEPAWKFTEKQKAVVDFLKINQDGTVKEVADVADVSKDTARRTMNRLEDHGVMMSGPDPTDPNRIRYVLTGTIPEYGILGLNRL